MSKLRFTVQMYSQADLFHTNLSNCSLKLFFTAQTHFPVALYRTNALPNRFLPNKCTSKLRFTAQMHSQAYFTTQMNSQIALYRTTKIIRYQKYNEKLLETFDEERGNVSRIRS